MYDKIVIVCQGMGRPVLVIEPVEQIEKWIIERNLI